MSKTCSEVVWLDSLLTDFQITIPLPVALHCDNKAVIHIAQNPVFHERTKHIRLDCYYIRDHLQTGFIQPIHVKISLQIADVLTKPLGEVQHQTMVSKLGLVSSFPCPV